MGNHGGGPTRENIDHILKMDQIDAFPRVQMSSVQTMINRVNSAYPNLPVWNDELYLECHRGTLTTQAQTKRNNRKCKIAIESAEKIAVVAGIDYPVDELREAWRLTLFNQFHDILPGSSICEVYEDADMQYRNVHKLTHRIRTRGLDALLNEIDHASAGIPVLVFNPLNWSRNDSVRVRVPSVFRKGMGLFDAQDREIRYTISEGDILFSGIDIPAIGYRTLYLKQRQTGADINADFRITLASLENRYLKIEVNPKNGNIAAIYDKRHNRDVLQTGQEGNLLQAFEDRPTDWDAWNIGYTGKEWKIEQVKEIFVLEDSAERIALRVIRPFNQSRFIQDLVLYPDIPRLDIEDIIDWHEEHVLVKAAFPVNVRSEVAAYEIPFGHINRRTVAADSYDAAKFEVSGHKWIDLSESDHSFGVSLLNDCKYGFDVKANLMRMTLLRSPKWPADNADMGRHRVIYSVFPHTGDWRSGGTCRQACELNTPFLTRVGCLNSSAGHRPDTDSFLSCDKSNIIMSAVKKAEEGSGMIVRLYETDGIQTSVQLKVHGPIDSAFETNLLENIIGDIVIRGSYLLFEIGPYEIKTLVVKVKSENIKV
ncbi:MAG: glycoside hydrolase family 38 C-terminal domain-containing protein [candidate division KSB1 bacterium]|nr:glycoside hydrolase family 38 C-terminal domain-containing protein [candidate division KSB1 bacterium]